MDKVTQINRTQGILHNQAIHHSQDTPLNPVILPNQATHLSRAIPLNLVTHNQATSNHPNQASTDTHRNNRMPEIQAVTWEVVTRRIPMHVASTSPTNRSAGDSSERCTPS